MLPAGRLLRYARHRLWLAVAGHQTLPSALAERLRAVPRRLRRTYRARRAVLRLHGSLALERVQASLTGRRRPRALVTVCWDFPVYSHSFVYQEITQLIAAGFDLRLLYGRRSDPANLGDSFSVLWRHASAMVADPDTGRRDVAYFRRTRPQQVDAVFRLLGNATAMSEAALLAHDHVLFGFSFARAAETYRADYLHSYFFYDSSFYALIAGMLLDLPRGVSCYADHMLNDYDFKLVAQHLAQAKVVVATSARIKRELCGFNADAAERIIVKPNAVDVQDWQRPARETEPGGRLVVLAVSRIDPKKGLQYLARAAAILRDRGVPVLIRILGAPDNNADARANQREILDIVAAHDLADIVEMPGAVPRAAVRAGLFAADVLALPSVDLDNGDKDGIPTALLEAMACALPVVATDAGSITEVVTDDRNGLLVPQRDAVALADALARLAADADLRERLGAAARQTVIERFDVAVCEGEFHRAVRVALAADRA